MSKMKKRVIFSSVCVILLLALVGGSLAWFYANEEVSVTYGNSIFCEAGDSLEISLMKDGKPTRWSSTIDYSLVENENGQLVKAEYTTVDISGDGSTLYRPAQIDENQQPDPNLGFTDAVSNLDGTMSYDYVEMCVAFRSISEMSVFLADESSITPVTTDLDKKGPSMYGNFSRDYIAGAMRVAVIDYTTKELLMLWAPNSDIELAETKGTDGYTYTVKTGAAATPESNYYFYAKDEEGNVVLNKVSSDLYASKKFVVDATGAVKGNSGNAPALFTLTPAGDGTPVEKYVIIRIWFEGTDREAHQALAGGNVNVNLKFIGIDKKFDAEKQDIIDAISFNENTGALSGLKDGMVFSIDGRTWTKYENGMQMPVLERGDSIYIKYPETATHFETNCRKFFMK